MRLGVDKQKAYEWSNTRKVGVALTVEFDAVETSAKSVW
jgi:hypothetical protein